MNRRPHWNPVARALHWTMAALIVVQAAVGWIAQSMNRSPARIDAMTLHKSLGITLLLLLLMRVVWRLTHAAPKLPPGSAAWEVFASRTAHFSLYALLAAIMFSGWTAASAYLVPWKLWWVLPLPRIVPPDKATHEFAAGLHEALIVAFLVLLAVHVAAALWHHFVKRDDVLAGMWRGRN